MRKITEQSFSGQLVSILGLVSLVVALLGSVVLFAADSAIDDKYATDADVLAVQEQVAAQVNALTTSVDANTRVSQQTAESVQALALSMVTIQIRSMEPEIRELEREKAGQGQAWSTLEEQLLRDMRRSLTDLETQRRQLFASTTGE